MFFCPPSSTKKTIYYNFFPTKEEEEREKGRSEAGEVEPEQAGDRVVVEIRDIYPPPVVDLNNPWVIKKTLTQNEIDSEKLVLTWHDTFEHVLRYWSVSYANSVSAEGIKVGVTVWDVTQENCPRKYDEMDDAHMHIGERDDFYVMCRPLMKDRYLKVYDEIGLYWDYNKYCFMFRLFLNAT